MAGWDGDWRRASLSNSYVSGDQVPLTTAPALRSSLATRHGSLKQQRGDAVANLPSRSAAFSPRLRCKGHVSTQVDPLPKPF